jgi:uncharacterized protein (TIGR00730 family)
MSDSIERRRICVFCGSAFGANPEYRRAAEELGTEIGRRGLGLVYGGASAGTMGMLADSALAAGAEVSGVIPRTLVEREIAHRGLSRLYEVETMHERKALMASLADAFIALPGGYGTLDEFLEILTWAQLRIHSKPCALINTLGYYDGLLAFLDNAVREGFLKAENRDLILVSRTAEEAVSLIGERWASAGESQTTARTISPIMP